MLYFIGDLPIAQSALRRPGLIDQNFLFDTLLSKRLLLPTAISVSITGLTVVILTFAGVIGAAALQTYLFFSLFLLQISILCHIAYKAKAMPQAKRTVLIATVLVGAIALLALLSALIDSFGAFTGVGAWTTVTAILLPLCPLLYFILKLLLPFLNRTAK